METNPYDQENIPWTPSHYLRQEQVSDYQGEAPFSPESQERYQKIQPMPRMPREQVLTLIRTMKQSLLIFSVVGFAGLGWLIAAQQAVTHQSFLPVQAFPYARHADDAGGFFDQHGRTQFGKHHHRDFGQGQGQQDQGSPDQGSGPVSGTHVS